MIAYLLLTSLTVSLDSFVCGFSLSLGGAKKLPVVLGIALTVFAMCLITNYAGCFLVDVLSERTAGVIGGAILCAVGFYNLIKKDEIKSSQYGALKLTLVSGFAVGLDGAFANLSLSIMGINAFYVPLIIGVMHGITIGLGVFLANTPIVKKLHKFNFIAPLILMLLGAYKIIFAFV